MCFLFVPSLLAVILGAQARKSRKPPAPSDGRGKATAGLILGVIGLILGASLIAFSFAKGSTSTQPSDLKTGQCVKLPTSGVAGKVISTVPVVSCSKPHNGEVAAKVNDPSPKGTTYPGSADLSDRAGTQCRPVAVQYVAADADVANLSIITISPDSKSWNRGNRSIECIVQYTDGNRTTVVRAG